MEQSTQTNSTDIEYINIYDKPKPKRGRPSPGIKLTDGEKAERARQSSMKYYSKNTENKENENHQITVKTIV